MFFSFWFESRRRVSSQWDVTHDLHERRRLVRPSLEALEDRTLPSGSYLFVSDYDSNTVMRYDAATGAFVDTFVATHSGGAHDKMSARCSGSVTDDLIAALSGFDANGKVL